MNKKSMKHLIIKLCLVTSIMMILPNTVNAISQEIVKVKKIQFSQNEIILKSISENKSLEVIITPKNATDKTIVFESSNIEVVTIDGTGSLVPKANGTAIITATSVNGKTARCKVNVEIETTNIIEVTEVSLDTTTVTLKEKDKYKLTAKVLPENATNKEIIWKSSNTKVATVGSTGEITAKGNGKAVITAMTSNGKTANCTVTVKSPVIEVTRVSLNTSTLTLVKNNKCKLTAKVLPENATNKDIIWKSSNTKVATVGSTGEITAKGNGKAVITATTSNGKTAKCTVTVKTLSNEKIKKTISASSLKKKININTSSTSYISQSFCITDKYYICALISKGSNPKTDLRIYNKYTGKLVNTLKGGSFYHANGMTYNRNNKTIYIAHMTSGKYSMISAQNINKAKSIKKKTKSLSKKLSAIAYDEYTGNYYTAVGRTIRVYNSKFKLIKTFSKKICNTPQDIGAYKGLILVVDYKRGTNAIDVYRASSGKYLGRYTIKVSGELESIAYDRENNNFALYVNHPGKGNANNIYTTKSINLDKYCI